MTLMYASSLMAFVAASVLMLPLEPMQRASLIAACFGAEAGWIIGLWMVAR